MRRAILSTVVVFGVVASGCGADGDDTVQGRDGDGEIVVTMSEFNFGTDVIEVTAGETVTFVILNEGAIEHEFMIGRNMVENSDGAPNGFEHDFFETSTPSIDPAEAGMNMGAMAEGDEMDMTDGEEMAEGEDVADGEEMAEGEDHAADEGMDSGADVHAGYMVSRRPGEVARLTVTVPDDVVGEWQIGCFEGDGSHWDAGMQATLNVKSA